MAPLNPESAYVTSLYAQLPPGYLVYKYVLHYEASPKRFPSRAQQLDVNIECHYERLDLTLFSVKHFSLCDNVLTTMHSCRDHSVHQLAVQPTWQTVVLRKTLKGRPMDFQINFMDGKKKYVQGASSSANRT